MSNKEFPISKEGIPALTWPFPIRTWSLDIPCWLLEILFSSAESGSVRRMTIRHWGSGRPRVAPGPGPHSL